MARISLLLFACFVFFVFNPCLCCPQYQKQALLQFKLLFLQQNTTSSSSSSNIFESWNSTSDCCRWDGISCDSLQVTALQLSFITPSLGFNTLVPSAVLSPLFHLQTLTSLDISFNGIHGEIPGVGLANLTNLVLLRMNENNFYGSIPPQLFSLRHLEHLNMMGNSIQGTLSSNIGDLSNLRELHLDENSLHGEIPVQIGNLTKLTSLSLSRSKFSGAIPASLVRLKELQELDLSLNILSGEIPIEIGNLSNIQWLTLSDNNLSGEIPPSIQKLEKRLDMVLENNFLSGEIPTWLFDMNLYGLFLGENMLTLKNMSQLVPRNVFGSLSLRYCNISGEIPIWLSNQTILSYLDMSENDLQGNFPKWLAEKKNIVALFLSKNKLSGSVPPGLFQSNQLQILILSSNNFSGLLPDSIGEATNLVTLVLSDNNFFGPVPSSITKMPKLKLLDLSFNNISSNSNEFPIFNQNSSLKYIDLSFNKFAGDVPVTFPSGLRLLALNHNEFSRVLPQSLSNFSLLAYLDLQSNNLVGQIPPSLFQISSLQFLNLRDNNLEGSIPTNLTNLNDLQILDLSSNNLHGKIPTLLGYLSGMINEHDPSASILRQAPFPSFWVKGHDKLNDLQLSWKKYNRGLDSRNLGMYTFLDLSNNQLRGEIPDSFGALRILKSFNLSYNKLSGTIPMSFGDMQSLESLDLSHNSLSGEIPQTLANLLQLTYLNLSNNKLQGRIPTGPQMDRMNDPNSYANNSNLCGMQIQVPCEKVSPGPKPTETIMPKESDNGETWFSWKTAIIGYISGFLSIILAMYVIGYFNVAPQRVRRHHVRHNLFCF